MTIEDVKKYYDDFDCEVLTSNLNNREEIQRFSSRLRSNTLENYLKTDAWEDDKNGETRVYLIRDHKSGEIVLFFSLKCGCLFTTYELDDKYNALNQIQKSYISDLVNEQIQNDSESFYKLTNVGKNVFGQEKFSELLSIAEHRARVKKEIKDLHEENNVLRVSECFSAIEIKHLCRSDAHNTKELTGFPLGFGLFWRKIVPLVLEIAQKVGCEYLYVFAADRSDDPEAKKLITYYKDSLCFHGLDDDGVVVLKPGYDENCSGLLQSISVLPEMKESIWERFSDHVTLSKNI